MLDQDRPIKPNKEYVEQCQAKYEQQLKQTKNYLKKGPQNTLACFRNVAKKHKKKQEKLKKTKAQIYQQMKMKNRQKFGQWNKNKQDHSESQQKKISAKNMTVRYQPKQIKISTQQYKKPGYVAPLKKDQQDPQKLQYSKMIEFMKNCYNDFQKQKQEFQKQKQSLKFKHKVSQEQGINIQIAPKIKTKQNNFKKSQRVPAPQKQNLNQSNLHSKSYQQQPVKHFSYTLQNIHQCQQFTLRQLCKFTPLQIFDFQTNSHYQQAQYVLETERDSAQVQQIDKKRYTKFCDGWFECWLPGKYRTAYNKQKKYKVTWYGNGDIRQQFDNMKVITYYSKKNHVNQIEVQNQNKIFFFLEINQLQMHSEKGKEIRFPDGHFQFMQF